MPTYEYKCKDCDHIFALRQALWASRTGAQCPSCGGSNTERIVSRFNPGKGDDSCGSKFPFS